MEVDHLVPIGVADVRRAGNDVTVVAIGRLVDRALEAAERLEQEDGISVEVIDPAHALAARHRDDRRVDQPDRPARRRPGGDGAASAFGVGGLRASRPSSASSDLKAPPVRVASPFVNVPTPVPLAEARAPGVDDVVDAVRNVMKEA